MTKRLLIVTDSIGAPRCDPETVSYEETWVYGVKQLFENAGYDVFCITHNGLHSSELLSLAETKLTLYQPSIIILQCGVVDCAPRVLRNREILLARMLHLDRIARFCANKYHAQLSRWRNITLHSVEQFDSHLRKTYNILKKDQKCAVIQIPIAPACADYVKKSPLICSNIEKFNHTIAKYSDVYIDKFSELEEQTVEKIFMSDHHHLNQQGHSLLFEILRQELSQFAGFNAV